MSQPEFLIINESIRLIKPKQEMWVKAIPWYQNSTIMYYSEGVKDKVYDKIQIDSMYRYLSSIGELYFIEVLENGEWKAIGDVTLSSENLPIVIGDENYWGKGIGKQVVGYLIKRARNIGIKSITLNVYTYNERSQHLFLSLGFKEIKRDESEIMYKLNLENTEYVDLSHVIDESLPHFPGDNKIYFRKIKDLDKDYYNDYYLQTNMHAGTHIDTPMHLLKSGKLINEYRLDQFIADGILIDASNEKLIQLKEEYTDRLKKETCVLIYTGHDKYFYQESYYEDYPVLSEEMVNFLIEKNIKILGLDTPSPDNLPYELHKKLLENNIFIVENLTNLDKLINTNFELYAIPLNIKADSSPARVFAKIVK